MKWRSLVSPHVSLLNKQTLEITNKATKGELWKVLKGRWDGLGTQSWRNNTAHAHLKFPHPTEGGDQGLAFPNPNLPTQVAQAGSFLPHLNRNSVSARGALLNRPGEINEDPPTNNKFPGEVLFFLAGPETPLLHREIPGWPGKHWQERPHHSKPMPGNPIKSKWGNWVTMARGPLPQGPNTRGLFMPMDLRFSLLQRDSR